MLKMGLYETATGLAISRYADRKMAEISKSLEPAPDGQSLLAKVIKDGRDAYFRPSGYKSPGASSGFQPKQ